MSKIIYFLLFVASTIFSLPAWADSASLLSQAQAANPTRYQFAVSNNAEIRNTSDNKAFTVWWQPSSSAPTGVIVNLHGHASYATDGLYLWHPYLQARGYAILSLQWWFGGGEATSDYYQPQEMYPIIASILKEKGVKPGTVLFHGYSRGSANTYAVTALDTFSGNRYFKMTLSNAGGATANYPPNQQIVAGDYGLLPFSGVEWVMYCGELDPDPTINGCSAMKAAKDWVIKYGATFKLLIEDPSGGHGGFQTNSSNVETALAQFVPAASPAVTSPSCTLSASPATITSGATSTLTASCSPAAASYAWSDAACSSASASCSVAPTVSTTYTVSGSNTAGAGKVASAAVVVGAATTLPGTQDLVTVYEFYHAGLDHYFRTADAGEASGIDNGAAGAGWVRTGDDFRAYSAATTSGGAVPVCRFYGSVSPGPNSHFYTASQEECAGLKALQQSTPNGEKRWNYEGLAFAVALPSTSGCPAGSTSIYRLYNNGFAKGADSNHRYTSLQSEYQRLQSAGWGGESVVMCSPSASSSSSLSPPASVALTNAGSQTVGGNALSSSTQLTLSWTAPSGYTVDHYAISASESVGNTSLSYSVAASGTSATLTGLKSGTSYSVVVSACKDAACAEAGSAAAVSGKTSEEYWQLQGSGNSYTTLSTAVSDGSVLSWVMRWGSDAGAAYAGRYQYYYGSRSLGREGVGVATTSGIGTDASTLTSFSTLTTSGLRRACSEAPGTDTSACAKSGAFEISTIQAVPMTSGKIRAFVNAADVLDNNSTRIYSLDSQDGLIGQDFHPGAQAYCGGTGSSDYAPGGSCALNLLVDVSSAPSASTPLSQARQFKIGYDWNADWRWDGAAGTFMVITGDDNCSKYPNALFYAAWDASQWAVAKDSSNCAKPLVAAAHGPVLVPLGGVAYKLYYEDQTDGPQSGKPLRLLYGDGRSSGSEATVDFGDWESGTLARQVNFLWPDGSLLDAQDEAGLGDHMILTPTGNLDLQYMFLNRGGFDNSKWKAGSSGLGIAVLLNP